MANQAGSFISLDDSTRNKLRLDVGRVFITTHEPGVINKVVEVKVNDVDFSICLVEETLGANISTCFRMEFLGSGGRRSFS